MLREAILENEIVGSAGVAVNDHQDESLETDQIDRGRVNHQWLAGMIKEQILSVVKGCDLFKVTNDAAQISASDTVECVAEDLLHFAVALVEKFQSAIPSMWENWQQSMNFLVVAAGC